MQTTLFPDIAPSDPNAPFGHASPRVRECTAPWLTVDVAALRANYRALQAAAPSATAAAAVKANGYGLGIPDVAKALQTEGCQTFFVANTDEGAQLRSIFGPRSGEEIFVLNGGMPGEYADMVAHKLSPVLNHPGQLDQWRSAVNAHRTRNANCALHIDTGMNRLGFTGPEVSPVLDDAQIQRDIGLSLVMSHLACADEPEHPLNTQQLSRFQAFGKHLIANAPHIRLSLANSAGIFLGLPYWFDLTRPGIGLYGGAPDAAREHTLQPVAHLHAPIIQLRTLSRGDSVGYGASYVAPGPRTVATLACGYADGVLRAGSSRGDRRGGYGWLNGVITPILGRVSMDLIVVDVTEVESAKLGDRVELLGAHVPVDDVAAAANTISYEILTRLSDRCIREVVGVEDHAPA